MPDNALQTTRLTHSEVLDELKKRGTVIGSSSLSELIKRGDIAQQLQQEKVGVRTFYPADVVAVLLELIERLKDPRVSNDAAPDILRSILTNRTNAAEPLSLIRAEPNNAQIALLSDIRDELRKALPPPPDRLLTLKAAATEYGIPLTVLRPLRVSCGRRLYVRESDCRRLIAGLERAEK